MQVAHKCTAGKNGPGKKDGIHFFFWCFQAAQSAFQTTKGNGAMAPMNGFPGLWKFTHQIPGLTVHPGEDGA